MINFTGEMRRNEGYCGKENIERMSVQGAFSLGSGAQGSGNDKTGEVIAHTPA
jgi:hypothetical protein